MTNINVRWDKFRKIADDILQGDPCYCKEKYGRFDTTYYGNRPGVWDRLLKEVEFESEQCCQHCGKHSKQVWTDTGRIEHFCLGCYSRLKGINAKNRKDYGKFFKGLL